MGLTQRVNVVNPGRRPGRLLIRADDPSLTPYAGLAISGELGRSLRLVELVDAELAAVDRAAPVKQRRRGLSPGELTVAIAEAQLVGAECFDDIEVLRADEALAPWRAVAATPSAPTARQLACRFRPSHIRAIERAVARCGNELDGRLGQGCDVRSGRDRDGGLRAAQARRGTQPARASGLQQLRGHVGRARPRADQRAEGRQPGQNQSLAVAHAGWPRRAAAALRARADHGATQASTRSS